jgi:RNA polymerase sigma-70 factor (ECF subfamily)
MPIPPHQASDEELIAELQRDDDAAFDILVDRYKDPLKNFVYRFVGDPDEAHDIVQETLIRVYRSRNSYKPGAKFSTWIYTIATNLAKSHLRRRKLRTLLMVTRTRDEPDPVFEGADEAPGPDVEIDSTMKEEQIQKALGTLPVRFREVIVFRDIQEMSYEEIVAITGLPMGTVKSRINRGRSMLQDLLKSLWGE